MRAPLLVERLRAFGAAHVARDFARTARALARFKIRRHLRSLLAEDFAEVERCAAWRGTTDGAFQAMSVLLSAARSETAETHPITGADMEAMLIRALDTCADAVRPLYIGTEGDAHDDRGHL